MNQGKLEVVKQEMARVNVDILGMGEFNSDDHYIYYCWQESLRRNGVAIMVNKRPEMQYLDAISNQHQYSYLSPTSISFLLFKGTVSPNLVRVNVNCNSG